MDILCREKDILVKKETLLVNKQTKIDELEPWRVNLHELRAKRGMSYKQIAEKENLSEKEIFLMTCDPSAKYYIVKKEF